MGCGHSKINIYPRKSKGKNSSKKSAFEVLYYPEECLSGGVPCLKEKCPLRLNEQFTLTNGMCNQKCGVTRPCINIPTPGCECKSNYCRNEQHECVSMIDFSNQLQMNSDLKIDGHMDNKLSFRRIANQGYPSPSFLNSEPLSTTSEFPPVHGEADMINQVGEEFETNSIPDGLVETSFSVDMNNPTKRTSISVNGKFKTGNTVHKETAKGRPTKSLYVVGAKKSSLVKGRNKIRNKTNNTTIASSSVLNPQLPYQSERPKVIKEIVDSESDIGYRPQLETRSIVQKNFTTLSYMYNKTGVGQNDTSGQPGYGNPSVSQNGSFGIPGYAQPGNRQGYSYGQGNSYGQESGDQIGLGNSYGQPGGGQMVNMLGHGYGQGDYDQAGYGEGAYDQGYQNGYIQGGYDKEDNAQEGYGQGSQDGFGRYGFDQSDNGQVGKDQSLDCTETENGVNSVNEQMMNGIVSDGSDAGTYGDSSYGFPGSNGVWDQFTNNGPFNAGSYSSGGGGNLGWWWWSANSKSNNGMNNNKFWHLQSNPFKVSSPNQSQSKNAIPNADFPEDTFANERLPESSQPNNYIDSSDNSIPHGDHQQNGFENDNLLNYPNQEQQMIRKRRSIDHQPSSGGGGNLGWWWWMAQQNAKNSKNALLHAKSYGFPIGKMPTGIPGTYGLSSGNDLPWSIVPNNAYPKPS